jgi:oligopeptide transport system substrate-binding protein
MVYERNPSYRGRFTGNVQRLEVSFCPSWPVPEETAARMLEAYDDGEVDCLWTAILLPETNAMLRRRHPEEYLLTPPLETAFLEFDVTRSPFDDLRVRRAFALATDRRAALAEALHALYPAATGGLVPPGTPGHSPGIGLPYDCNEARHLLAQAGFPCGRGLPSLYAVAGYAPRVVEAISAQWREALGVETTWEHLDGMVFFQRYGEMGSVPSRLSSPAPHLWLGHGESVLPDPCGYLQPAASRPYTGWQDERFERLLARARQAGDRRERLELYRQADRVLIEQAAVLPLAYAAWGYVFKPWIGLPAHRPMQDWPVQDIVIRPH